ncbi:MAG: hypothetical protein NC127_07050 [Muribaculum sp.]|nr:hypothetical protein [Muribaculum sp.]
MAKVYLFNPENDVALGYWKQSFTLTPMVKALHADGAAIPMWYASPGDYVYDANTAASKDWRREMSRLFGLEVNVSDRVPAGLKGMPWGWSVDAARQLSAIGAKIPDYESLLHIRELSHRRLTTEVMSRLKATLPFRLPDVPLEAWSTVDIKKRFADYGEMYVKAPWSSSGRGVIYVDKWTDSVESRISNIIRRQGSVMCECAVDKRRDFALEFYSHDGVVEWVAYSLFFNGNGTSYGGNLLAPDSGIEAILVSDGVDLYKLNEIKKVLVATFTDLLAPHYEGYFGVDMMVAKDGMIAPCVEVNLRMTMGMVAAIWRDRYLSPGACAKFTVGPANCSQNAGQPPIIKDGRLLEGHLSLTPPDPDAKFAFQVEVMNEASEAK